MIQAADFVVSELYEKALGSTFEMLIELVGCVCQPAVGVFGSGRLGGLPATRTRCNSKIWLQDYLSFCSCCVEKLLVELKTASLRAGATCLVP